MGRGTAQEVERLKSLIVEEATRLFASQGFGATSISDVAKASGVSKALVLYHFGSKDGLRDCVMGDLAQVWGQLFPRVRDVAAKGDDVIRGVFVQAVEVFRTHPDLARLMMREILSDDPSTGQALKKQAMPVLAGLEDVLRDTLGVKVPEDFDVQAAFVFFGLALLAVLAVFPLDGQRLSESDVDLGVRVLQQGLRSLGLTLDAEAVAAP